MSKLRFSIAISLDGYVAGRDQSEENPLGIGGDRLHESPWQAGITVDRRLPQEPASVAHARGALKPLAHAEGAPTLIPRRSAGSSTLSMSAADTIMVRASTKPTVP
jgi:hypothetical protein